MNHHRKYYVNRLTSRRCGCGNLKARQAAVCMCCYRRLTADQRKELDSPIGNGFEPALDEAEEHLNHQC